MNFLSSVFQRALKAVKSFSVNSGKSVLDNAPYWIAALFVGVFAVLYAKLFSLSEGFSKYLFKSNPFLFVCVSIVLFICAWMLIHFFAPNARGSGIPQVMAATEEASFSKSKYLGLKISLVKVLSSILCVMGGGAIGREGPTLQVSASIFHFFGNKLHRFFDIKIKPEIWIIAGASAGLSAAFNTPLGGLVYAIEELSRSHLNNLKTPLITAVIVSGLAAQVLAGPYLYIGLPALVSIQLSTHVYIVLVALLCGFLGAVFGRLLYSFSKFVRTKKSLYFSMAVPTVVAGVLFLYAYFIDPHIMGSGKEELSHLLFGEEMDVADKFTLAFSRFIGPILTYLTGVGGGIFAPSLAAGGAIGGVFADLVGITNHNLLVMLGMISFLTGVTRSPFTSFVLVLEMTDRHSAIIPMMLAALVSSFIAPFVDEKSIYEKIKEDYLSVDPDIKS